MEAGVRLCCQGEEQPAKLRWSQTDSLSVDALGQRLKVSQESEEPERVLAHREAAGVRAAAASGQLDAAGCSWMLRIIFYTSEIRRASDAADQASDHLSKQRLQHRPANEPRRGWSLAPFSVTCSHMSRYMSPIIDG